MLDHTVVIYALLGGIIPAIFWLNFWLKEDNHSEPRHVILGTFLSGMAIVLVAIPLEHIASLYLPNYSFYTLLAWSFIEEMVKFSAAYLVALKTRFNFEPIDATIYLITAALGFAALENTLFLLTPLAEGDIVKGIATINLRFIGATLLHVVSSGIIGLCMGYAFYKSKVTQKIFLVIGIMLATLLHAMFNNFIIKSEHNILFIFSAVWIGLVIVILILEHIKKIKRIN